MLQRRGKPDAATLIGAGKVEEIAGIVAANQADLVVFDHDRIIESSVFYGPADVIDILLKRKLRRLNPDHYQSLFLVSLGPRAEIWKRANRIDAGIGPEIDENDLAAQTGRRQGL